MTDGFFALMLKTVNQIDWLIDYKRFRPVTELMAAFFLPFYWGEGGETF